MKVYFPILLSKAGELNALKNLTISVKSEIAPVLQVIPGSFATIENFAVNHWNFQDNQLFLDFSLLPAINVPVIRNFIANLIHGRVNVIPVLQQNSDQRFTGFCHHLVASGQTDKIGIRFSNQGGGYFNVLNQINDILTGVNITAAQATILLDFGYVNQNNHQTIALMANFILNGIQPLNVYDSTVVASSSFPENLTALVPQQVHQLPRYEWQIWQTLITQPGLLGTIKYGDYGTKHAIFSEANFRGSCSIKYSAHNNFVIYRGERTDNHPQGHGQYNIFAGNLLNHAWFSGTGFSWGDAQIGFYAQQSLTAPNRKSGNAQSWVSISQNHHITLLHSLL